MSATWLWSRSSSSRSARTHRSCSVTAIPAASSTAMAKASACPTAVSPLIRSAISMASAGSASFEELLDASVDEPEPGLHPQDGFADDGEPEVAGLDEAGVHGSDGDLVDAVAFDLEEGEGAHVGVEARVGVGVAAHRVPALGPVAVTDQPVGQRVALGGDAVEVADLTLEAADGVADAGEARDAGLVLGDLEHEFHALVVRGSDEDVDDPEAVVVLGAGDHGHAVAVSPDGARRLAATS